MQQRRIRGRGETLGSNSREAGGGRVQKNRVLAGGKHCRAAWRSGGSMLHREAGKSFPRGAV